MDSRGEWARAGVGIREAGRGWPGQSCGLGSQVLILLPPLTLGKSLPCPKLQFFVSKTEIIILSWLDACEDGTGPQMLD